MNPTSTLSNPWSYKPTEFEQPKQMNVWETLPSISIDISSEQGGSLFKHTNYMIHVDNQVVLRRYSDFDFLNSQLTSRYPSRLFLPLPPKKFSGNKETDFVLQRKKGLTRYLLFVYRHPIVSKDSLLMDFLTQQVFVKHDGHPSIDLVALETRIMPPIQSIFHKLTLTVTENCPVIDLGWLFEWENIVTIDEGTKQSLLTRRSEFVKKLEAAIVTYFKLGILGEKLQRKHKGNYN